MSPKRQIICADCGGPAIAVNSRSKYCKACVFGRQAEWHDGRLSQCRDCGEKYVAWGGHRSQPVCGSCIKKPHTEAEVAVCGFCKEEKLCWHPDLKVCYDCKDRPINFGAMKVSVAKNYEKRRQRG